MELKTSKHEENQGSDRYINYLDYVLDQLSELDNFTIKKLSGGIGFFRDGLLFGSILGGKFRLKFSSHMDEDCTGGKPERYVYHHGLAFCEVPEEVLDDKVRLSRWAEKAYQAALEASRMEDESTQ